MMVQALVTCDMSEYVVGIELCGTDNRTTLSHTLQHFGICVFLQRTEKTEVTLCQASG
jgi:hypothetical protein